MLIENFSRQSKFIHYKSCRWVCVTKAWFVLWLQMEERPAEMNTVNEQPRDSRQGAVP